MLYLMAFRRFAGITDPEIMKALRMLILCLTLPVAFMTAAAPQIPDATQSKVLERGPHHRVIQKLDANGTPRGSYVELETGMHRLDPTTKQWIECEEKIDVDANGGVINSLQYGVRFAPNLNSAGPVQVTMPDGAVLNGGPIAVAYRSVDQYVVIAELQDSFGVVAGNTVTYPNAFKSISADVQFVAQKGSFEQFLVIKEQIPPPSAFNLPDNSVLELVTEFQNPPEPVKSIDVWQQEIAAKAADAGQPSISDERISFPSMQMPVGRAFTTGAGEADTAPVAKNWLILNGRRVLIEQVKWADLKESIERLPAPKDQAALRMNGPFQVAKGRFLPAAQQASKSSGSLRMAQVTTPANSLVIDYTLVSSATNFTFQGDTTYFVSGVVNLSGTTVIEAGSVIKFTNYTSISTHQLNIQGPLDCQTSSYRPAVFTAKDDDMVGEPLSISTGVPSITTNGANMSTPGNYYGGYMLKLNSNTNYYLHDLRFTYGVSPIAVWLNFTNLEVRNVQFTSCYRAIYIPNPVRSAVRNVLFRNMS